MIKEENKDFGLRIKHAMNVKGLRNKDVVDRCKNIGIVIHPSTVSQYLAGRFAPTEERVELMASVLGVDKNWLQGYGSIEDMSGRLNGKELEDAVMQINNIFSGLRPDLQRMMLDFADILNEISVQSDLFYQHDKSGETGVPVDLATHFKRVEAQYKRYKKK